MQSTPSMPILFLANLKNSLLSLLAMIPTVVLSVLDSIENFADYVGTLARVDTRTAWRLARFVLKMSLNVVLGLGMFYAIWYGFAEYLATREEEGGGGLTALISLEVIPYPEQVADAFEEEKVQVDIEHHLGVSLRRLIRAMLISTLIAWPLGVLLGQSKFLNWLFSPLLALVYPMPKVVFLSVFISLFDIDNESKIAYIVSVVFFQMLVVVRDEARSISPNLIDSVRSLGAGRRALYWFVYVPASLGAVLTAWRVSVGPAIAVLYVSEITIGDQGLGYYIYNSGLRLRYDRMMAGIIIMSLVGVGLYMMTDVLERIFLRWKRTA